VGGCGDFVQWFPWQRNSHEVGLFSLLSSVRVLFVYIFSGLLSYLAFLLVTMDTHKKLVCTCVL